MRRLLVLALLSTALVACTAILGLRDDYALADGGADVVVSSDASDAGAISDVTIDYVQGMINTNSNVPSIKVTLLSSTKPGDLVVVAVGWEANGTAAVTGVFDNVTDAYAPVAPAAQTNVVFQQMFYLVPDAGGSEVNVTMSASCLYLDVRVVEYSGPTTPDHYAAYADGGQFPTVSVLAPPNELLVAAGMANQSFLPDAGGGFTVRFLTPLYNIIEDRVSDKSSNFTASSELTASGNAVFQLATFK